MKNVLITGVGRGIGRALALKFLENGYFVIGTSLNTQVDIQHDKLKVHELDLSSSQSIEKFAKEIAESGLKIDILVNNAGVLFDDDETSVVEEKLRKTLEVNLIGTINLTEKIIPFLSPESHVISISSTAGSLGLMDHIESSHYPYHYPAYKISKTALNMYTRTLARRLEHEGHKTIVSAVHPGWVKTDIGGDDAEITPEESAKDIYEFAITRPETGYFWHKGSKIPW